jgi:hypothetical protein
LRWTSAVAPGAIDPRRWRLLDEAGIRWKVVIVSALLRRFRRAAEGRITAIITASSATKISARQVDATYLARALFDEELPHHSFERSTTPIHPEREAPGYEPSEPQIHMSPACAPGLQSSAVLPCASRAR